MDFVFERKLGACRASMIRSTRAIPARMERLDVARAVAAAWRDHHVRRVPHNAARAHPAVRINRDWRLEPRAPRPRRLRAKGVALHALGGEAPPAHDGARHPIPGDDHRAPTTKGFATTSERDPRHHRNGPPVHGQRQYYLLKAAIDLPLDQVESSTPGLTNPLRAGCASSPTALRK